MMMIILVVRFVVGVCILVLDLRVDWEKELVEGYVEKRVLMVLLILIVISFWLGLIL